MKGSNSKKEDWKTNLQNGVYNASSLSLLSGGNASNTKAEEIKQMTPEQEKIISAAEAGYNLFFTGSAGVGKSFILRHLITVLQRLHGQDGVFVTGSTGVAATHIGGTTVHSFAGFGIATDINEAMKRVRKKIGKSHPNMERWANCKVLIIDEISMISPEFFSLLDQVGKRVRKVPDKPFGGIQVIVTGDFLQLPPVNKDSTASAGMLFDCKAWKDCMELSILLTKVHRQKNIDDIELLQHVRLGSITDADDATLRARMNAKLTDNGILPTRVYTHNRDVQSENNLELAKLKGPSEKFGAHDSGSDKFALDSLKKSCLAPDVLELKIGAQVMLLKNLAPPLLVNGSRGRVVGFYRELQADGTDKATQVRVEFDNGSSHLIGVDVWNVTKGYQVVATRKQIPLCLAWAITIHKCQGMTLDKMQVDISSCWEPGQAYVALSRCTALSGLSLLGYNRAKITSNPKVLEFYQKLGDVDAGAVLAATAPVLEKSTAAAESATKKQKVESSSGGITKHWWQKE